MVDIADELGVSPSQVALNWCIQKNQVVVPIIGAKTLVQIEDSLACLNFKISDEHIARLNEVSKIEIGFPHDFLASDGVKEVLTGGTFSKIHNHRK